MKIGVGSTVGSLVWILIVADQSAAQNAFFDAHTNMIDLCTSAQRSGIGICPPTTNFIDVSCTAARFGWDWALATEPHNCAYWVNGMFCSLDRPAWNDKAAFAGNPNLRSHMESLASRAVTVMSQDLLRQCGVRLDNAEEGDDRESDDVVLDTDSTIENGEEQGSPRPNLDPTTIQICDFLDCSLPWSPPIFDQEPPPALPDSTIDFPTPEITIDTGDPNTTIRVRPGGPDGTPGVSVEIGENSAPDETVSPVDAPPLEPVVPAPYNSPPQNDQ